MASFHFNLFPLLLICIIYNVYTVNCQEVFNSTGSYGVHNMMTAGSTMSSGTHNMMEASTMSSGIHNMMAEDSGSYQLRGTSVSPGSHAVRSMQISNHYPGSSKFIQETSESSDVHMIQGGSSFEVNAQINRLIEDQNTSSETIAQALLIKLPNNLQTDEFKHILLKLVKEAKMDKGTMTNWHGVLQDIIKNEDDHQYDVSGFFMKPKKEEVVKYRGWNDLINDLITNGSPSADVISAIYQKLPKGKQTKEYQRLIETLYYEAEYKKLLVDWTELLEAIRTGQLTESSSINITEYKLGELTILHSRDNWKSDNEISEVFLKLPAGKQTSHYKKLIETLYFQARYKGLLVDWTAFYQAVRNGLLSEPSNINLSAYKLRQLIAQNSTSSWNKTTINSDYKLDELMEKLPGHQQTPEMRQKLLKLYLLEQKKGLRFDWSSIIQNIEYLSLDETHTFNTESFVTINQTSTSSSTNINLNDYYRRNFKSSANIVHDLYSKLPRAKQMPHFKELIQHLHTQSILTGISVDWNTLFRDISIGKIRVQSAITGHPIESISWRPEYDYTNKNVHYIILSIFERLPREKQTTYVKKVIQDAYNEGKMTGKIVNWNELVQHIKDGVILSQPKDDISYTKYHYTDSSNSAQDTVLEYVLERISADKHTSRIKEIIRDIYITAENENKIVDWNKFINDIKTGEISSVTTTTHLVPKPDVATYIHFDERENSNHVSSVTTKYHNSLIEKYRPLRNPLITDHTTSSFHYNPFEYTTMKPHFPKTTLSYLQNWDGTSKTINIGVQPKCKVSTGNFPGINKPQYTNNKCQNHNNCLIGRPNGISNSQPIFNYDSQKITKISCNKNPEQKESLAPCINFNCIYDKYKREGLNKNEFPTNGHKVNQLKFECVKHPGLQICMVLIPTA